MVNNLYRKKYKVTQIFRYKRPNAFSIERVYKDIRAHTPGDIVINPWTCPHPSKRILQRVRGALAARETFGPVRHVTGDVHYLTYFLPKNTTILTIHDCEFMDRSNGIRRLLLWLFWLWLAERRCAYIVAVSSETKRSVLKHIRCKPEKIVVIPNPVSPEFVPCEKKFNDNQIRVLQIGTKKNKNLRRLAEALKRLPVNVVIIGTLSEEDSQCFSRYGVAFDNRSNLCDTEIRKEYELADVVTMCSTYEGFGMPIIEGQCIGRPVITSRLSPMCDVAGEGACLVDPWDPASIRAGFLHVIEDNEYRNKLVAAGFRNAARYSAHKIAAEYAALYRSVAERLG